MRLSQQTKNAVSVLVYLARNPDVTPTVPEIAEGCEITEYNTFKLVPLLARTGFLKTIRGRNGGVVLAMPAAEISVGAVVRATDSELQANSPKKEDGTQKGAVTFDAMVDDAFLAFVELLDRNSIAELAANETDDANPKVKVLPAEQPQPTKVG